MDIYAAISKASAEIVKQGGISKDRKNQQQGYAFRGVEDFLNMLAPILPRYGLVIVPRLMHRELFERVTAKGGVMYHAIAEYEFDFFASDGSSVKVGPVIGEAMDSGDKAHNKTLSMAYKYACMIAFCIPTDADDADAVTPELTHRASQQDAPQTEPPTETTQKKNPTLPPQTVGTFGNGVQTPSTKANGNARRPSPISDVQKNKIRELFMQCKNMPAEPRHELNSAIDALFIESFGHGMIEATYEEGARITGFLIGETRKQPA